MTLKNAMRKLEANLIFHQNPASKQLLLPAHFPTKRQKKSYSLTFNRDFSPVPFFYFANCWQVFLWPPGGRWRWRRTHPHTQARTNFISKPFFKKKKKTRGANAFKRAGILLHVMNNFQVAVCCFALLPRPCSRKSANVCQEKWWKILRKCFLYLLIKSVFLFNV